MNGAAAIVLAAGAGDRLGAETPKAFVPVAGTTMLMLGVGAAAACPEIETVVAVVPQGWERRAEALLGLTQVDCTFYFGGLTFEQARRSQRLFATEVMPHLGGRGRGAGAGENVLAGGGTRDGRRGHS